MIGCLFCFFFLSSFFPFFVTNSKQKHSFTVSEYGFGLYANFQFDLYDVVDRPLEWLFAIFSANVTRVSLELMGVDKRITGS